MLRFCCITWYFQRNTDEQYLTIGTILSFGTMNTPSACGGDFYSGTKKVTLVAHSIGSTLLMETLRQLSFANDKVIAPIIDGVVLISPDIDETLFQMQLRSLKKIPEPFIIFSDDKDIALKISSFLTGRRNRLGQITNADVLEKYGILVIDTSEFKDGDGALNHSVTLTSPSIIAILKELPAAVELTQKNGGNPRTLLQTVFNQ